jgi:hypothetical protein
VTIAFVVFGIALTTMNRFAGQTASAGSDRARVAFGQSRMDALSRLMSCTRQHRRDVY